MEGGIQAWQGLTADGPPEGGIAYFAAGTNAADMTALAWALEENTRKFYLSLADKKLGAEETGLFTKLAGAEKHHEETLESIHKKMSSASIDRFHRDQDTPTLEGGVNLNETLSWAEDKSAREILVASIGLEANAYDRYLKMAEISKDDDAKEVFRTIAREEKGHLQKLGALLDQKVGKGESAV